MLDPWVLASLEGPMHYDTRHSTSQHTIRSRNVRDEKTLGGPIFADAGGESS